METMLLWLVIAFRLFIHIDNDMFNAMAIQLIAIACFLNKDVNNKREIKVLDFMQRKGLISVKNIE